MGRMERDTGGQGGWAACRVFKMIMGRLYNFSPRRAAPSSPRRAQSQTQSQSNSNPCLTLEMIKSISILQMCATSNITTGLTAS